MLLCGPRVVYVKIVLKSNFALVSSSIKVCSDSGCCVAAFWSVQWLWCGLLALLFGEWRCCYDKASSESAGVEVGIDWFLVSLVVVRRQTKNYNTWWLWQFLLLYFVGCGIAVVYVILRSLNVERCWC